MEGKPIWVSFGNICPCPVDKSPLCPQGQTYLWRKHRPGRPRALSRDREGDPGADGRAGQ